MTPLNLDFRNMRQWRGSQHQAFEELCYQLRDPTPKGAELVKTGNPDGGLEWYITRRNGTQWGWQAKYSFEVDNLLKGMENSLKTVVKKRPNCRRLTFCIPFDLPDAAEAGKRKSARQKFEDKKQSWARRIPGADRVRIDLWSEGDILQRLVRHPGRRGITRFFWDKEVFSPEWCAHRMSIAHDTAGRRYTPELHIDLPVSFALEGLAMSEAYWRRLRDVRNSVWRAVARIQVSRYTGLGVTNQLRQFKKKMDEWQHTTPEQSTLPQRLEKAALLGLTQGCIDFIHDADPPRPPKGQRTRTQQQRVTEERILSLSHYLRSVESSLREFQGLLLSDASEAAANGALLLEGSAGQGKTHLFCDMGDRAVKAGQPAVVILGGSLSGRDFWSEIAKQLGLANVGSEELVSAMQAAAEASNAPFLLLVDALNEAADPAAWQEELPRLLAEVAQNPWISVAVSVRSTFLDMVLPEGGLNNVTEVEHHGFDGRELEATERFFDAFGLEQPRIPLLTPEFTNPLFLKLYCESLHGMGLSAAPLGEAHLSQTFERYLKWKEQRIAQHLKMDPALLPVQAAIDGFSKALVEANSDNLPYENASNLIDAFGSERHQWPDTLFGRLLSEGVLSKDLAWDFQAKERRQVVRFTYQQFADYQVGSILLAPFGSDAESLGRALSPGEPLHQTLLDAPPSWIEALAVLVPERFGIELLDTADWDLDPYPHSVWTSALMKSICVRRPSAVTERTSELLLAGAREPDPYLEDPMLEIWLSVATQPQHLLNADWLHKRLKRMSMPDRDVAWSLPTYYTLDDGGPLDRLIRWASRSLRPDCPPEVVVLAAIALAWTFTSPNRILRDHATKALSQLLSAHLSVLPTLISRFAGVNDPYVIERLVVACHGAALCGGTGEPQAVVNAAEELKRVVFADDQRPNFITRDAVRGIYEWCFHNGWVDEHTYAGVLPPYSSTPPNEPPTEEEIRRDYDIRSRDTKPVSWPYGRLLGSVFEMGDFGRYIIQSAMHHFTPYPLDKAIPTKDPCAMFNATWAQRWVFQRVISLGWTPEYFADFDQRVNWLASRTDHKPERFGKKYQWIAFHELIARIADNFHMMPEYGREPVTYEGPWQLLSRDIDPTLPPPPRTRNVDEEIEVGRTFAEDSDRWWLPDGPHYRNDDPPAGEGWGTDWGDIPEFEPLVRCQDGDGRKWVVLHAWYNWTSGYPWERTWHSRRREMWGHIYSWLVRPKQREMVVGYIEQRSFMNRWMPEGAGNTDAAYLGELPWAISRDNSEDIWKPVRHRWDEEPNGLEVYPAWEEYDWEGNIRDCSIDDGVRAWYPAPFLFDAGALTWNPRTREWRDPTGVTVAQFVESSDHSVLLVREDWLKRTLREAGLDVIFGWLGEKQLLEKDGARFGVEIVGGWTVINAVASLDRRRWRFGQRRLETRYVSNDDPNSSNGSDGSNGTDIIRQMLRDSGYGE